MLSSLVSGPLVITLITRQQYATRLWSHWSLGTRTFCCKAIADWLHHALLAIYGPVLVFGLTLTE